MPEDLIQAFKPEYVVPLVLLLTSDQVPPATATGLLYEVGCGWQARTRWQRSGGYRFSSGMKMSPEIVEEHWAQIVDFEDGRATHPSSSVEASKAMYADPEDRASNSLTAKL